MRRVVFALLLVSIASCGGGGPTAPSTPSIPAVAGNYNGTATIAYPELQTSVTCSATTAVTQSGAAVSVAPIVLSGSAPCVGLSLPLGQVTIDSTGAFTGPNAGTTNVPSCGNYTYSASGGFFGREMRISMVATSTTCVNFNFTASLTR